MLRSLERYLGTLNFVLLFVNSTFCGNNSAVSPRISELYGYVWFDTNANGNIDPGESGIANVQVILYTCAGQFVQSTTTESDGSYYFDNVQDGSYKVYIEKSTLPLNYSFTFLNYPNTDNQVWAHGFSDCYNLDENEYVINAGLTILSVIGNFVWDDLNGNGIQDLNEPGIVGININLYDQTGSLLDQTVSGPNGVYNFTHIFPGQYYIEFIHDSIWIPTKLNTGNPIFDSDVLQSNGISYTENFDVSAGINRMDIDAGFYKCAKICGVIYSDTNTNDLIDSHENGINGIMIFLWKKTEGGIEFYDMTTTARDTILPSKDGYFSFCVPPGIYFVSFNLQPSVNLVLGLPFIGNNPFVYNHFDESNGPMSSYDIETESGNEFCYINAGLYCGGNIIGSVWLDTDFDGLRDEDEQLIEDIDVELYDSSENLVSAITTGNEGVYKFDRLKKGFYFLRFSLTDNLVFTQAEVNGGLNSPADSDVNNSNGQGSTSYFYLGGCDTMLNLSAGYSFGALSTRWIDLIAQRSRDNFVELFWKVGNMANGGYFEVLKSLDPSEGFISIGNVNVVKTHGDQEYSYKDRDVFQNEICYYKIKFISFDGKINYSPTVKVVSKDIISGIEVYPNPAGDFILIGFNNFNFSSEININLINNLGQNIKKIFINPSDINYKITIPVNDLVPGTYTILISGQSETYYVNKIVVR